jgi:hypothetical protein
MASRVVVSRHRDRLRQEKDRETIERLCLLLIHRLQVSVLLQRKHTNKKNQTLCRSFFIDRMSSHTPYNGTDKVNIKDAPCINQMKHNCHEQKRISTFERHRKYVVRSCCSEVLDGEIIPQIASDAHVENLNLQMDNFITISSHLRITASHDALHDGLGFTALDSRLWIHGFAFTASQHSFVHSFVHSFAPRLASRLASQLRITA